MRKLRRDYVLVRSDLKIVIGIVFISDRIYYG